MAREGEINRTARKAHKKRKDTEGLLLIFALLFCDAVDAAGLPVSVGDEIGAIIDKAGVVDLGWRCKELSVEIGWKDCKSVATLAEVSCLGRFNMGPKILAPGMDGLEAFVGARIGTVIDCGKVYDCEIVAITLVGRDI